MLAENRSIPIPTYFTCGAERHATGAPPRRLHPNDPALQPADRREGSSPRAVTRTLAEGYHATAGRSRAEQAERYRAWGIADGL